MDYAQCFARGIHVLSTGKVFAQAVAEIGLGFALSLERNIAGADRAFRRGEELWGGDGNGEARVCSCVGSEIGVIGFGNLGRALNRLLQPFRAQVRAHDPWLPASVLREAGVEPASLDEVLTKSDVIFVLAAVTTENGGFLGATPSPACARAQVSFCSAGLALSILTRSWTRWRGGTSRPRVMLSGRAAAARSPRPQAGEFPALGPSRRRT